MQEEIEGITENYPEQNTEIGVLGRLFMGISTAKMLDFLLSYREFDYSETDIAKYAGVSSRQVYRALPILKGMGIVYQTRMSGRSKMYKLRTYSEATRHLEKFVFALAQTTDDQIQMTLENNENEITLPQ